MRMEKVERISERLKLSLNVEIKTWGAIPMSDMCGFATSGG